MSFRPFCGRLALLCLVMLPAYGAPARAVTGLLAPVIGVTERFASEQRSGVAMEGFDPVSYRFEAAPKPGRAGCEYLWNGVVWQFANEANRAAFMHAPETFAPRIGGYDAERISSDVLVAANPEFYVVQGNALYLFRSPEHRSRFLADGVLAKKAEATWTRLQSQLVGG
jgi:YHS domain-containing protein